MSRIRFAAWVAMLWLLQSSTAFAAAAEYKIVTASERGTYIQIGKNLAQFVAPAADIELEVLIAPIDPEQPLEVRARVAVRAEEARPHVVVDPHDAPAVLGEEGDGLGSD